VCLLPAFTGTCGRIADRAAPAPNARRAPSARPNRVQSHHRRNHYPAEEILDALTDARSLRYEPAPAGLDTARLAVAGDYYRGNVETSGYWLTASTSEAYAYLIKLLTESWATNCWFRAILSLSNILAALRVGPDLALSPWCTTPAGPSMYRPCRSRYRSHQGGCAGESNNPTGSFVKKRELGALVELCREHDLASFRRGPLPTMRSPRIHSA